METTRATGEATGFAHVATVSFLASRAVPSIGFWLALAGGVALARAGERHGARVGYGTSVAATLETVALVGPARFNVPLTQALSAPLLGALERRATPVGWQMVVCGAIRLSHVLVTSAFAVFVLTGGLDVYTQSYESLTGWIGFVPQGRTAALVVTGAVICAWTVFASVVQVLVYRRGLRRWTAWLAEPATSEPEPERRYRETESAATHMPAGRFDPRAVALAAAIAFALLIANTSWPLLAAVAGWLALAALAGGGDRSVVGTGALLAALLGTSVLVVTFLGGLGADEALRRGIRAALFVLVATWLRAAAGADGLREVSRRVLGRLGRVPPAREAAAVMDRLGSGRQLGSAVRSMFGALRSVPARPMPVLDAVLGWVIVESARFRPAPPAATARLRIRTLDVVLVVCAAATGGAIALA